MSKIKLLTILSGALIAINLVLIGFILFRPSALPKGERERPRKIISEKLKFDNQQMTQFDQAIKAHKESIIIENEQMGDLKMKLYATLKYNQQNTDKDSLMKAINAVQLRVENIHYKHFEAIKAICKPEQQKMYDELCLEMSEFFSPPKRKP
jgi:periplasmic protein CpxP/Spy